MAFSHLLYVTIFSFSLLSLSIGYRKRSRKSSVSHLQLLSLPPSRPARTYDVFLSFRGEDTRNNFVGHLYKALDRYGIYTFKDDQKLEKGKTVAPELLKSIEESRYSIVILSENYATSTWCLDELVKIIHCMDQFGQIVVPIFYNVDPSDVRKQTGSFKRAFDRHERAFKKEKEKVLQWREALKRVDSISGSDSRNRDESVLIEEIVRDVSDKLFSESSNDDNKLVGMSYHMEQMNSSLLCNDGSEGVLMVGIYGMGGIGKTAISRTLYNRYSRLYNGICYVSNVKDIFRKHGPSSLRERLLSEIFQDRNLNIRTLNENFNVIKERLSRKKVFIVLDDVDDVEQLETLADKHEWFGPGSRIIITTREQRLLISHGVNYLYEVMNLRDNEAFHLFSQYAFRQDIPTPDYLELSEKFVLYAKGLPLALKILGSFLHKKSINEWVSEHDKLKKIPNTRIQDVLRISFDGLDDKQKDIFLDIACFIKREDRDSMINVWEGCGFFPETGLRVLKEKSLITISYNELEMHDLLREMGWEIVRQESIREPGERSRLWLLEDVCRVFKRNTGTKAIEGIFLDISNIEELQLTREVFRKMHNLRFLKIYLPCGHTREFKETIKVHLPHGLEGLSDELRCLHWHGYPLKCLPCNFQPENLVELIMPYSNLEQPWEATNNMKNLKTLELTHSRNLKDIGDFSLARNLEFIDLEGCISLQVIHPSIQYLDKVQKLNLRDCKNIRSLPDIVGLVSLAVLTLSGCSSIENLPDLPRNIKILDLSYSENLKDIGDLSLAQNLKIIDLEGCISLQVIHPSIQYFDKLEELHLRDCKNLRSLPDTAGLVSLAVLTLSGCSSIENLPGLPRNIENLDLSYSENLKDIGDLSLARNIDFIDLEGCISLQVIHPSIQYLDKLEELDLRDCKNLTSLPDIAGLVSLAVLTLSGCTKITELPDNLGDLSSLVVLEGEKIGINRLPSSVSDLRNLVELSLSGCKGKHSAGLLLPPLWGLDSLRILELKGFNIVEFPEDALRLSSLETLDLSRNSFERIDLSLGPLSNLIELKLNECKMLQSISNLPPNIRRLQAHNCSSLERVSSSICKRGVREISLNNFVFTNCFNLKHISLRNVMIDLLERL